MDERSSGQFLYYPVESKKVEPTKPTKKSTRALAMSVIAAFAALTGGAIGAGASLVAFSSMQAPAPVVVNNTEAVNWVTGAALAASPSVVTLSVNSPTGSGSGSGVLLTEDGYALTNSHVVTLGGSTNDVSVTAQAWDGRVYEAEVIGTDPTNDIAVIKLSGSESFQPIEIKDSDALNVGEPVVAIGAPLGLSSTVTQGIVSALNRTIQVASSEVEDGSGSGLRFWDGFGNRPINLQVIQTDAAINPGNSGGALVDQQGRLVGINVAIATSGSSGNIGVGFAIPANTALRISEEIIEKGFASHGLLGALVTDSVIPNSSFASGAEIVELTEGGAADAAGLEPGDVVVLFDGDRIEGSGELTAAVRAQPAGAEVEVEVLRDGQRLTFQVTLGDSRDLESN
ncbi:MAG TPA: trypsin-like peptidase domain-containing protein [Microbacteriaceae bacterium]